MPKVHRQVEKVGLAKSFRTILLTVMGVIGSFAGEGHRIREVEASLFTSLSTCFVCWLMMIFVSGRDAGVSGLSGRDM